MSDASHKPPAFLVRHRLLVGAVANVVLLGAAYTSAFLLRLDLRIPPPYWDTFLATLPVAVALQYAGLHMFKLTRGWWRYVGVVDFANAVKASVLGTLGLATYVFLVHRHSSYPRSIFFLYPVLSVGFVIGSRVFVRLWRQIPREQARGDRRRLLIIGAGDTGEALLREIRHGSALCYEPVAFLDDDPHKHGVYINGVPVVGVVAEARDVVERMRIDEIIAATPSATGEQMRVITRHCREAGVPFKVLPATWEVLEGRASLGLAREVDINDLLRRPRVQLDLDAIGEFLTARRVLVTGAAGSIGAEICSQVLRFKPARLVCLDHAENGLFFLERNLARLGIAADISYCLADVTEGAHLDAIFRRERPDVVFHAAAHKHVPMLEANPVEGARNNVLGTETVATLAGRHGATAFVMISTDKAVNPTSVMGATKRIAERLVQCLPFDTRYTTVRFGNVLGSAGSVVPILKDQIAAGGPVTITHPDMRRYFMTIPEAVELVLQAAAMGDGNEIFVLDMGEPVKIVDLANDLIRLSGLEPGRDIDIVFTGVRPGEKLFEELYLDAEAHRPTSHPKILVARHVPLDEAAFRRALDDLKQAIAAHDAGAVRRIIPRLVPEFQGDRAAGNVVPFEPAAPRGA